MIDNKWAKSIEQLIKEYVKILENTNAFPMRQYYDGMISAFKYARNSIVVLGYDPKVVCCGTCMHWRDNASFEHDGICPFKGTTCYADTCDVIIHEFSPE